MNSKVLRIVWFTGIIVLLASSVRVTESLVNRYNIGKPAVNSQGSFFRNSKTLSVPIINQPYQFACNVTATAAVLQYRGINVSPDDVFNSIPKETAQKQEETWGNPNLGFVGNIYGEYGGDKSDGYGVHWGPIAEYINKYRPAEVKQNWNVTEMLKEVDLNNPTIVWVQNDYAKPIPLSWSTKDKSGSDVVIKTVLGMHSEIVVGYTGTPDKPEEIILNDPWASRWNYKYSTLSLSKFKELWNYFGNTAIVVK